MPWHFLKIIRSFRIAKYFCAFFILFESEASFLLFCFRPADKKLKWNTDDYSWAFVGLDVRNKTKPASLCIVYRVAMYRKKNTDV